MYKFSTKVTQKMNRRCVVTKMNGEISSVVLKETVDLKTKQFDNKDQLFGHMISLLYQAGKIKSKSEFLKSLNEREEMGSTYMGNYIAIPHGKSSTVKSPCIAFCRCNEGILYESNNETGIVKLIFMLAIPADTASSEYIRVLSTLARLLTYEDFMKALYESINYESIIDAIKTAESKLNE